MNLTAIQIKSNVVRQYTINSISVESSGKFYQSRLKLVIAQRTMVELNLQNERRDQIEKLDIYGGPVNKYIFPFNRILQSSCDYFFITLVYAASIYVIMAS